MLKFISQEVPLERANRVHPGFHDRPRAVGVCKEMDQGGFEAHHAFPGALSTSIRKSENGSAHIAILVLSVVPHFNSMVYSKIPVSYASASNCGVLWDDHGEPPRI